LSNFGINFSDPVCSLAHIYLLVLIARAILSWFPLRPDSPMASVSGFLRVATEPVVAPFRRVIPPVGMFDISYLVAFIVVSVGSNLLCRYV
jgi:YggT family protein